jgi:hypothetical protein
MANIRFKKKNDRPIMKGRKISILIPSLSPPQGIWLKRGRNGGKKGKTIIIQSR